MNSPQHEENGFFTPSLNFHTEPDLHNAEFYRHLVEGFLAPNSHASVIALFALVESNLLRPGDYTAMGTAKHS